MEIYCKHCKYVVIGYRLWCGRKESSPDEEFKPCIERNKDNDCPVYKRKWYKFWLKPKPPKQTKVYDQDKENCKS